MRRGAIQALAASGMKAGDIIKFSGHSSVESLVTYLDDGALDPAIIAGLTEGNVLFGGALSPGGPYPPTTDEIIQAFPSCRRNRWPRST